ncbi:MAG: M23 family metallopeptidase [Clostridia bacterium]|nr:M23 family metallopeptidase [Clostridia bacterium]
MERAIAEMEKIRRAEEIYSRRKNAEEEEKKQPKSIYKILFEILFFINVIVVVAAVQNQKYIFTEDFLVQVNSYNINVKKKIEEIFSDKKQETTKQVNSASSQEENQVEESKSVSGESNDVSSGALVENEIQEEPEQEQELSQEEQDVQTIKNTYSVILPVSGVKTSGFGERESTNPIVTKYHTGVDIGASKGTVIQSATTGKVIQVSSAGDYGKHIKIQTGDLVTLYAHCSKIYVQEGQEVTQGENIAEVGATGNATGPHLHFELRLNDRYVNPEKIITIE